MKLTACIATLSLLGLVAPTVLANPAPGPLTPNSIPQNVSLSPQVSGKISLTDAVSNCKEIKVELSNTGNFPPIFKLTGKVTQTAPRECSYVITVPQNLQGKQGKITVSTPIGTYFVPGNWQNPLQLPLSGNLENINGMIKRIG